jgi:hypothetical protein
VNGGVSFNELVQLRTERLARDIILNTDLRSELEFFLELAAEEIKKRDRLILELVGKLAAIAETGAADSRLRGHLVDPEDLISKAQKMAFGFAAPTYGSTLRT